MTQPWWDRLALAVGKPLPRPLSIILNVAHVAFIILVLAEVFPSLGDFIAGAIGRSLPTISGFLPILFVLTAAIVGHAYAVERRKQLRGEISAPPGRGHAFQEKGFHVWAILFLGMAGMFWMVFQTERSAARCEAYVASHRTYEGQSIDCPPEIAR